MKESEPITRYMAKKLITFAPGMDIREAMRIILKNKISGGPVLSKQGELIGMLSEKDCLHVLIDGPFHNHPVGQGNVSDFMSTNVTTIGADKTIMDAAYVFTQTHIRRLPVVEKGKLVGQISRRDILTAILKMRPDLNLVPDSWKSRKPMIHPTTKGRHNENS